MPEEINRILTDHVADLLFTHSADADRNLRAEGVDRAKIVRVGNVMVDSLRLFLGVARGQNPLVRDGLGQRGYAVLTLHRPSNVDDPAVLTRILSAVERIAAKIPVVFPVHPRTRTNLRAILDRPRPGPRRVIPGLLLRGPMGYVEFLGLMAGSAFVLTDSGGVQEETTALRIPCLTLRDTTERPVTVRLGTNATVGTDPAVILAGADRILSGTWKTGRLPGGWDGRAADRIVDCIRHWWKGRA
jgi:UDP-N-acetylglucosamine 2-epimerase (non-hydrolysing)